MLKRWLSSYSKPEIIVLSTIALFLLAKTLLITPFTTDTATFLETYKFTFADSYDWVANGLRLFENDAISFRNPGYVLLIKLLHSVNAIFLLPFFGNLAFFVLLVYVYKICKLVSTNIVALIIISILSLNYTLNLGSNAILADIYAVAFISGAFYYLLTKKYYVSLIFLSASMLFQNIGYVLLLGWIVAFIYHNKKHIIKNYKKRDYSYFIKQTALVTLILSPVLLWSLYKLVKFGDPLYSKVTQIGLINPNFDSVDFYVLNALSLFGLILIPTFFYIIINAKKIIKNDVLIWSLLGLSFMFVFWVISYDWDDRRFLVYFIPFLFPLIAYYLQSVYKNRKIVFCALLLLFYPSILPIRGYLVSDELPLYHNTYLIIDRKSVSDGVIIRKVERADFNTPIMNLNPTLYNLVNNYDKFHEENSSTYAHYSGYLSANYDQDTNILCFDKEQGLRVYILRTVLQIDYNTNLSTIDIDYECEAYTY